MPVALSPGHTNETEATVKMDSMTFSAFSSNLKSALGGAQARPANRVDGAAIIAPETLLPSQLPSAGDELATRAGVKGLMLAILEDAVYCLADVSSACAKKRMEARKAEAWIREPGDDWLFSFDSICRVLDLVPEDLRYRLLSVPPQDAVPQTGRRRRSHRVERGKRKRRPKSAQSAGEVASGSDPGWEPTSDGAERICAAELRLVVTG